MMIALSFHLSVMVIVMSSGAMSERPNKAGNDIKAVKRSILRNTRHWRSVSSDTLRNTGWAIPFIVPSMVEYPMDVHLLA